MADSVGSDRAGEHPLHPCEAAQAHEITPRTDMQKMQHDVLDDLKEFMTKMMAGKLPHLVAGNMA